MNIRHPRNINWATQLELKHGCKPRIVYMGEGVHSCHFFHVGTRAYIHEATGQSAEEAFANAYKTFAGSPASKTKESLASENARLRAELDSVDSNVDIQADEAGEAAASGSAATPDTDSPSPVKKKRRKKKGGNSLGLPNTDQIGATRLG